MLARLAELERLDDVVERQPRVDDVLDEDDVPPRDRHVEILDETDARPAPEAPVVAGEHEEVHRVGDRDRAGEVCGEDERPLEDRDQDEVAALVVGSDLGPERADALEDLPLGQVDRAGLRPAL